MCQKLHHMFHKDIFWIESDQFVILNNSWKMDLHNNIFIWAIIKYYLCYCISESVKLKVYVTDHLFWYYVLLFYFAVLQHGLFSRFSCLVLEYGSFMSCVHDWVTPFFSRYSLFFSVFSCYSPVFLFFSSYSIFSCFYSVFLFFLGSYSFTVTQYTVLCWYLLTDPFISIVVLSFLKI